MLDIQGLSVEFDTNAGVLRAVSDVSYAVNEGEVVGVVGESGSGKSVTAQALLGLLPTPPARITGGQVLWEGRDLLRMSERQLRRIRGNRIGLVAQEPMAALNPLFTVGRQIEEAILAHNRGVSHRQARARAIELLEMVRVPNASQRIGEYPHQFSGGMAQRVAIAMAVANEPRLLIADEPTTALDVTVQAQVMRSLRDVQEATGAAMILISHDLALMAEFAHRLVVMYAGRVVESGDIETIFEAPKHPYTEGLLSSIPRLDQETDRLKAIRGQPPQMERVPRGCAFHPRCDLANGREVCSTQRPLLRLVGADHHSACHFVEEVGNGRLSGSAAGAVAVDTTDAEGPGGLAS